MSIDRSDRRPAYIQVADDLQKQINSGRYEPGEQIPSLSKIMESYGIAVNTARSATKELERRGLVVTRHGEGSYVLDQRRNTDPTPQEWPAILERLTLAVDGLAERVSALEEAQSRPAPADSPEPEDQ